MIVSPACTVLPRLSETVSQVEVALMSPEVVAELKAGAGLITVCGVGALPKLRVEELLTGVPVKLKSKL